MSQRSKSPAFQTSRTAAATGKARAARARSSPERGAPFSLPGFASPLQAKLQVSQPNDPLEAEADRVADQVVRSSALHAAGDMRSEPPRISRLAHHSAPSVESAPSPAVEGAIERMSSGGGTPLASSARTRLEPAFGRDLGSVRVHSDAAAHQAAADLAARAFTVGKDVFFAQGEYRPGTADGDRLLAHELTHVVQQDGGGHVMARKVVQREVSPDGKGEVTQAPTELEFHPERQSKLGWIDARPDATKDGKRGTLHIPKLRLPEVGDFIKGATNTPLQGTSAGGQPIVAGAKFVFRGATPRGRQRGKWLTAMNAAGPRIRAKVMELTKGSSPVEDRAKRDVFHLVPAAHPVGDGRPNLLAGTADALAESERMLIPSWDRTGRTSSYDVDHLHELQLGGADEVANYWLWDSAANQRSGGAINVSITRAIDDLLDEAQRKSFFRPSGKEASGEASSEIARPTVEQVKQHWAIEFDVVVGGLDLKLGHDAVNNYWLRSEVTSGAHVGHLRVLTVAELVDLGLVAGSGVRPKHLLVFPRSDGGIGRRVPWGGDAAATKELKIRDFFRGLQLTSITYDPAKVGKQPVVGSLNGIAFKKGLVDPISVSLDLMHEPSLGLGVWVSTGKLRHYLSATNAPAFSPIRVADAGIDESGALFLDGEILATKALFPGLTLPFGIRGDDVFLDVPIPVDSLRLGPIGVTDAALRVGYGKKGAFFDGSIDFAVAGLGSGRLVAGNGLDFAGTFDLDLDFLDPASISVAYEKDAWSGRGKLGLRKGVLPGIEKATVEVGIGSEGPTVVGSALLDIPGLRGIELTAGYDPAVGFVLAAQDIPLPAALLPGVSGGSVSIRVVRSPEGLWKVSGMGAAQIGVAGLSGNLLVIVDGRRLTVSGGALLEQGLIKGGVTFVVTNAPIDPTGTPIDGEPRDEYTAWGTGFASIQFGKYLTGTVQIEILPTGQWKLKGDIALPPTVEIFRRKDLGRPLFEIPDIEIPIAGIPRVASIYLFFGAGVHLDAWVGPASILGAHASIDFDPEHQDQTKVSGQGNVSIGAYAGIKLDVHGGVGAEIPLVDVKAGIHAGMKLGLGTTMSAPTKVEWSPLDGLSVETTPTLSIAPVLEFFGYIDLRVLLDLWLDTITVYREKWPLGDVRLPTDLKLDLALPIVWSEENGLDVAIDDRTIPKPDLGAIMSDLADAMIG